MQNSIYKIKYLFLSWDWGGVVFDCLGGNTPPKETLFEIMGGNVFTA